jgi:hypothetical protein
MTDPASVLRKEIVTCIQTRAPSLPADSIEYIAETICDDSYDKQELPLQDVVSAVASADIAEDLAAALEIILSSNQTSGDRPDLLILLSPCLPR